MTSAPSLNRRFGTAVFWNAIGTVALQGGTFATNVAVANLLGAASYGKFGFVVNTAQTLASVLQLSAATVASKYLAQYRQSDPDLASDVLGFLARISYAAGAAGTLLLLAFALGAADSFSAFNDLHTTLAVATPIVFCAIVTSFQMGALAGLEGFARSARAMLPLMALQIATTSAAAHYFGLEAAVTVMTLNFVARTWVCAGLLRREAAASGIAPRRGSHPRVRRIFIDFMLPSALSGLTQLPAMWLANAALTRLPDGYAELGRFNAAFALRGVLMIVPWIVNAVGFSLLNAHLAPGSENDHRRVFRLNLVLNAAAVGLGALVIMAMSGTVLRAYGAEFTEAATVLRVLMLSLVAEAVMWPLYQVLISRRHVWVALFTSQLPRDFIIAGLGVWLAGRYGALGVAWAHACGWGAALLGCALVLAASRRTTTTS